MIKTKTAADADNQRLGFEEATAKGKLYNPLSGKELLEFLVRHIKGMLLAAEPPVDAELADSISIYARFKLERHPALDTDVQAYPRADVSMDVWVGPLEPNPGTRALINIAVTKSPAEEKRGFALAVEMHSSTVWERPPLRLTSALNLDDVPPDALRILNDMPVPTPKRISGTGPSGESTIVDEPTPASEKQKEAVQKQFGKPENKKGGK